MPAHDEYGWRRLGEEVSYCVPDVSNTRALESLLQFRDSLVGNGISVLRGIRPSRKYLGVDLSILPIGLKMHVVRVFRRMMRRQNDIGRGLDCGERVSKQPV
jgi:hypothetical protein